MDKPKNNVESLSAVRNRDCQRRQEDDHFPHMSPSGGTISHLRLIIWLCQLFPLDWCCMAAKCELFLFYLFFLNMKKMRQKNTSNLSTAQFLISFCIAHFVHLCYAQQTQRQCNVDFPLFCPLCPWVVLLCCLVCVRSSEGTPKLRSEMLIRLDDSLWLGKQTLTIVALSVDVATVKLLHMQCMFFLRCLNVIKRSL